MMKINLHKRFFTLVFLFVGAFCFSQGKVDSERKDMYSAFHRFFEDEIRRQGVKLNWIFELEEITGLHTFDMDNNGLKEVLFEFDAVPVEGRGITNSYAVLFFETEKNKYLLGNYMETAYKRFLGVEEKEFRFYNKKNDEVELYTFENKRFNLKKRN